MKKLLLFVGALGFNVFLSCHGNDQKNETGPYQNYDTTSEMENLNNTNPDSIKSMSSPNGEIH